ncbi:MAG: type 4a pilus biogenesis protein PilO [candidate division Zixibacteria bacterium]|nr:type 4a pilus biogenesis protein PilO [candidate division Zixibacteria bacterium]
MDFKDPKNQILILVVFGFIVLIYLWHTKFYTPYDQQLTVDKATYSKLREELHAVKQEAASLDALQEEVAMQNARFENVKLWLPEKKQDEAFLAQLHIAAQQTNSTIIGITPQAPMPKEFYSANDYIVEAEATYHGLGNLFAKVVNFPFIVRISDIELKSKEGMSELMAVSAQKRENLTVSATFKLTTFNSGNAIQGGQTQ